MPALAPRLSGMLDALWSGDLKQPALPRQMNININVDGDCPGTCLAALGIEKLPDNVLKRIWRSIIPWRTR